MIHDEKGNKLYVGSKIVIPEPQEDDSWGYGMISAVDDINDDGTIMFFDDDYQEHEIESSRITSLI